MVRVMMFSTALDCFAGGSLAKTGIGHDSVDAFLLVHESTLFDESDVHPH